MIPASYEPRRDVLYWDGTVRKLLERLAAGQMTYVRDGLTIEEIMPIVEERQPMGVVSAHMRCERCGREWELVAGARCSPGYHVVS